MTPPIPVRLAALERDLAAFHGRIDRVAAKLPQTPTRDPEVLARVRPLYEAADLLRARAQDIARDAGRADFFADPVVQAERGMALVLDGAYLADRTVTQRTRIGRESHAEHTTSVTPGSDAAAVRWDAARDGRDLPNVRLVGNVTQPALNLVADRLENVPQSVIELTDRLGTRGALFTGSLTSVWGYRSLRGKQPPGWSAGKTWDMVPGAAYERRYAGNPGREQQGRGHGSTSLVLHEYAHTVDFATARPGYRRASHDRAWKDGPWRELRRRESAKPYFRNSPQEWYAEAFARYTRSPQSQAALARWYPETWEYFRSRLGTQQFG